MYPKTLLSRQYRNNGDRLTTLTDKQSLAWSRYFKDLESGVLHRQILSNCPQCRSDEPTIIAEKDRYGDNVITAVCKGCGLVYTLNQFDAESTHKFYRDYYRDLYTKSSSIAAAFENMKRSANNSQKDCEKFLNYLGLTPKADLIVELGCGGGWNLLPFQACGFNVIGFDYNEDLLACGRQEGLNLKNLNHVNASDVIDKASLIIIQEVLEHTLDPFELLSEINGHLRLGGYVFITVPPLEEIPYGYASGRLLGILQNAHNFLFDRATMRAYLEQAGFDVVFLRHDLRALAKKTRIPSRNPAKIPGNYERNMSILTLSENWLQWYWRSIGKGLSLAGRDKAEYKAITRWHKRYFSPARRREIVSAFETGY